MHILTIRSDNCFRRITNCSPAGHGARRPIIKEGGLTYDLNGNILSVEHTDGSDNARQEIDYTYDGYRLCSVSVNDTASADYFYNPDGNMSFDERRGLSVAYDRLN